MHFVGLSHVCASRCAVRRMYTLLSAQDKARMTFKLSAHPQQKPVKPQTARVT